MMADHNLFQAICRVNRLDGDSKDYGYIVDYKDLFKSLGKAIKDYTAEAFEGYDEEDVEGLLKDRLEKAKEDLDTALEAVKALCEPVPAPRDMNDYHRYFCGESNTDSINDPEKEALRLTLYKSVAKLLRCYANVANEMQEAGYTAERADKIKKDVIFYEKLRDEIKFRSADQLDMKRFEPAMRQLLDLYIRADDSELLMDFEDLGLLELIIDKGEDGLDAVPEGLKNDEDAMAETIENNVRKTIIDENPVNPKYYNQMSELLDELIELRRQKALEYQEYLEKIRSLANRVVRPESGSDNRYPASMNTQAKRALYDNFDDNEELVIKIDRAIMQTKKADWLGDRFKERELANAIRQAVEGFDIDIAAIMELVKAQPGYH